jgi:hypothetical protein
VTAIGIGICKSSNRSRLLRGINVSFWSHSMYSPECVEGEFSAPLCQAALREGACESATRLLKTASEMRLLRHRSASLRDLPSAIFLR